MDEAVVCPNCGCATEQTKKPSQSNAKQTNKNQLLGTLLLVAGFLVIAITAFCVLNQL